MFAIILLLQICRESQQVISLRFVFSKDKCSMIRFDEKNDVINLTIAAIRKTTRERRRMALYYIHVMDLYIILSV